MYPSWFWRSAPLGWGAHDLWWLCLANECVHNAIPLLEFHTCKTTSQGRSLLPLLSQFSFTTIPPSLSLSLSLSFFFLPLLPTLPLALPHPSTPLPHNIKGIVLEAYSPLGNPGHPTRTNSEPRVLDDPVCKEVADKHHASVAQVGYKTTMFPWGTRPIQHL